MCLNHFFNIEPFPSVFFGKEIKRNCYIYIVLFQYLPLAVAYKFINTLLGDSERSSLFIEGFYYEYMTK